MQMETEIHHLAIMVVKCILFNRKLTFVVIQDIEDRKVVNLEVTVEILKAFGELLCLDSDHRAEFLGFKLSYLRGQLGDAGLYGPLLLLRATKSTVDIVVVMQLLHTESCDRKVDEFAMFVPLCRTDSN